MNTATVLFPVQHKQAGFKDIFTMLTHTEIMIRIFSENILTEYAVPDEMRVFRII